MKLKISDVSSDMVFTNIKLVVLGGTVAAGVLVLVLRKVFRRKRVTQNFPRDTVILHNVGRGPYAPSLTPFAVKLETYLRIANVPYQNVNDFRKSSKGKFPWIEYNGKPIADSAFGIKFVNKEFNVQLNKGFSKEDVGAAHAFQKMVDENLYWVLIMDRWIYDNDYVQNILKVFNLPSWMKYSARRLLNKYAYGHGMGRHSKDEVYEIMRDDLTALSNFLGEKKFLLGDRPCETDCAVFGELSQFYWHCWGSRAELTLRDFPNLCDYCERIKETYWPDWDECTTRGGTQEATK